MEANASKPVRFCGANGCGVDSIGLVVGGVDVTDFAGSLDGVADGVKENGEDDAGGVVLEARREGDGAEEL